MAVDENYLQFIEDQLSEFGEYRAKKMFGGMGFFYEDMMFGMIGGGVFRLKADEQNRSQFESYGMHNYDPKKSGKGMPYWEVPLEIVEDRDALCQWAKEAVEAARRAKSK